MPVLVMSSDLPGGDSAAAASAILAATSRDGPLAFHVFRSILQPPSYHKAVVGLLAEQEPALAAVDPLVLAALQTVALTPVSGQLLPLVPLLVGRSLNSNSAYLIVQPDGNLVVYSHGAALWQAGTAGGCVDQSSRLELGGDGNLVLYGCAGSPLWETGTAGKGGAGAALVMQPDRSLVLYANGAARTGELWRAGI